MTRSRGKEWARRCWRQRSIWPITGWACAGLELHVYTDNAAGIRLYEKFGFAIEGTAREFALRDGTYIDAYAMARLRPA